MAVPAVPAVPVPAVPVPAAPVPMLLPCRRPPTRGALPLAFTVALTLLACTANGPPGAAGATTPLEAPADAAARTRAAHVLGRRLHHALCAGDVEGLVFDDPTIRRLLTPEAAARASLRRLNFGRELSLPAVSRRLLRGAPYRGVCLQDTRHEPAGAGTGLRAPGWVVGRVLVVGQESGGARVAAWVEGAFVYTDASFGAAFIERVEAPRRDHADLQIATCDLRVGLD